MSFRLNFVDVGGAALANDRVRLRDWRLVPAGKRERGSRRQLWDARTSDLVRQSASGEGANGEHADEREAVGYAAR